MKAIILIIAALVLVKSTSLPQPITPKHVVWTQTKVLAKKGVDLTNHADKSIQIASPDDGDFQAFIRQSSFWVDKSLLIPRALGVSHENYGFKRNPLSVSCITAPSKWGKSINLSMLKFYFELPVDVNGFETPRNKSASWRYFYEGKVVMEDGSIQELDGIPLISTSNLKDPRDLANYPVIYIKGANVTSDLDSFLVMIQGTYHQHENLLKRLIHEQQKASPDSAEYKSISEDIADFVAFHEWQNIRTQSEYRLQQSIKILSKILSWTYKRPVVILFDDYDRYIHDEYFNINHTNFSAANSTREYVFFYEMFMTITLQYNEYRTISLATGTIRTGFPLMIHTRAGNYHFLYIDTIDLFPFYGIFLPEFLEMARKRGIDQSLIENATQWYGGYRTLSNLHTPMYATYSVTRFINTLQLRNYRPTNSILWIFIKNLLQRPEIQPDVRAFVDCFDGRKVFHRMRYDKFPRMVTERYKMLRMMQLGLIEYHPEPLLENVRDRNRDLLLLLLLHEGYAALHENQRVYTFDMVNITLPNREAYNQISALLGNGSFYPRIFSTRGVGAFEQT